MYALQRGFKILEEGPSDEYFGESGSTNNVADPINNGNADGEVEAPVVVHQINNRGQVVKINLANPYSQFEVDDDNSSVPESNILSPED